MPAEETNTPPTSTSSSDDQDDQGELQGSELASQTDGQWQYTAEEDESQQNAEQPAPENQVVEWTASEFIDHEKEVSWFLILAAVTVVVTAAVYFITHDIISTVMIVIAGAAFGYIGSRKPRSLPYRIDNSGIDVANKHYAYTDFKSFSIVQEGGVRSIRLMPLKRFMVALIIYYAPSDEEKIVAILADQLPYEEHQLDVVDRFMHHIRF